MDTASGDSHWVFESQDRSGSVESGAPSQNATDKRFFWLALYAQPALWVALAIVSVVRLQNPIWLSLVGELDYSTFPSRRRKESYVVACAE